MQSKEFYRNYLADDKLSALSRRLIQEIMKDEPTHVLEFGCGTGKNLNSLNSVTCGLDISWQNITHAYAKGLPFLILGDETHLRHLCNFDTIFTVSVLDHIEDISGIIAEFKRIANKTIYLAETTAKINEHYYSHKFEDYGFEKIDFEWTSLPPLGDGATYNIWVYRK